MRSKHTEEQLAWLKNHLPKYEQKTSGATRGDAKKFALDCAATYIQLWGLPKTGNGDEEKESVVKEQIYTWFKNSCARGKDARMKHQQKKNAQQAHPPPPPGHHPGHHYPHHHPHAHPHAAHHGHGHPPQHLPYPGPPLHHQHPPRPPHPSLQHDDLRRRESLTLPPIHSYHPRPPSPGSSNSSARGSPVLRPVYPPPPPPRHPHHLPPTSSLRSTHALSIDTVPAPSAPPQQGQQNLAARLLALAAGAKVVDVAADALATPNPAPRVVDALFAAAASTSSTSSHATASSSSASSSRAVGMGAGGATLPTPVSVGGGSPVRSVGMDVDDDADADAEGEPESPSPTDHGNDVPLTVTSPSPSTSLRRSLSNSPSPSRTPAPTLPELLRAFAQLLSALPPADAAAARAALHCALRRPPPLPPASSPSPSTSTMHDFRERAESVRRLRREHVLWARVLSSCLSDCPHLLGPDEELREWRWFVRGCVKDALVSDDEEAGWLAGAYLLRGLRSEEREEGLVRAYESRWRDVRDERRLSEMGDVMVDLRH